MSSIASGAPINRILLSISQTSSFVLSSVPSVLHGLSVTISRLVSLLLVLSPVRVALYVFAPVLVFFQLAFGLLIFSPYAVAVYLLDALYPLYVFFGVACITGALIGLSGKTLAAFLTAFILKISDEEVISATGSESTDEKRRQ